MFESSTEIYDLVYSFKDYQAEVRTLHDLILARSDAEPESLLDVACGTGLHLSYLKDLYHVEGLDVDPAMLDIARARHPAIPFHEGNMVDFSLGKKFDVITCLFSSIGYVQTAERLRRAIETMAGHLAEGGLLVIEPWFTPDTYQAGRLSARFVDQPEIKIARMNTTQLEGSLSVIIFHYLVGDKSGIRHFMERHELGLFTHGQYVDAFRAAGLLVDHDEQGLMDRGLYFGSRG
jgi:SAM-dependent methyltransferase